MRARWGEIARQMDGGRERDKDREKQGVIKMGSEREREGERERWM